MKFSEYHAGMVITHPPITVERGAMIEFARQYDPQWFHTNPEGARSSRWGGLIASGWFTCSLAMRMVVDVALAGSESYGSPGVDKLRWMRPVFEGDALRLEINIVSVRVSSTRTDLGIVCWLWRMYNQRDEQVLELEATSFFDLSGDALPQPDQ
jgi:acyl dehydratase